uniref:sel1 repeat family protein n=1 Tax=Thaumasiovibrio occultus TaxID=1891184 RepID=UPI000B352868|nr:sel1 repeat family protein [Thaumasiovibrio occultus]
MKRVFLLLLWTSHVFAGDLDLKETIDSIDADESYQRLFSECPAELFPELDLPYKDYLDYCSSNPQSCLTLCNAGDANYCSSLANYMQDEVENAYYSEALFSKSCQLGLVSACTNRAAGLITHQGESSLLCAVKTFELSCSQRDGWGCTMYGLYLAQGNGVERDLDKALEVLAISCQNGGQDPACQAAQNISSQIKAARSRK